MERLKIRTEGWPRTGGHIRINIAPDAFTLLARRDLGLTSSIGEFTLRAAAIDAIGAATGVLFYKTGKEIKKETYTKAVNALQAQDDRRLATTINSEKMREWSSTIKVSDT